MNFSTQPISQRIEKPWGYEILFTPQENDRVGKILFIKAGCRISFQYHDQKTETQSLISGQCKIWLENSRGEVEKIDMELQKGYHIAVGQKHRLEAITDALVIEVSTPETGNTFRLEDDYARPTETEELRKLPNRGFDKN